jgi:hypothetical protein
VETLYVRPNYFGLHQVSLQRIYTDWKLGCKHHTVAKDRQPRCENCFNYNTAEDSCRYYRRVLSLCWLDIPLLSPSGLLAIGLQILNANRGWKKVSTQIADLSFWSEGGSLRVFMVGLLHFDQLAHLAFLRICTEKIHTEAFRFNTSLYGFNFDRLSFIWTPLDLLYSCWQSAYGLPIVYSNNLGYDCNGIFSWPKVDVDAGSRLEIRCLFDQSSLYDKANNTINRHLWHSKVISQFGERLETKIEL